MTTSKNTTSSTSPRSKPRASSGTLLSPPRNGLRLRLRPSSKTVYPGWELDFKIDLRVFRGSSRRLSSLQKSPVWVSERLGLLLLENASLLTSTLEETRALASPLKARRARLLKDIQAARDRRLPARKEHSRRWREGPKGRETSRRYDNGPMRQQQRHRWNQTPKGREKIFRNRHTVKAIQTIWRYRHGRAAPKPNREATR